MKKTFDVIARSESDVAISNILIYIKARFLAEFILNGKKRFLALLGMTSEKLGMTPFQESQVERNAGIQLSLV